MTFVATSGRARGPTAALIGLAHPEFREGLEREARENNVIPRGFFEIRMELGFGIASPGAHVVRSKTAAGFTFLVALLTGRAAFPDPDLGAIRWDGHTREGSFDAQMKEIYAYSRPSADGRVPFCGYYYGAGSVGLSCDTVAVAEQENGYAAWAGIDYWAFMEYPVGSGLEAGLANYDASSNRALVAHSLILNQHSYAQAIGPASGDYIAKTVARLQQSNYKKVLNGRPLVFVYEDICGPDVIATYCSPWLFQQLDSRLAPEPYYVYLGTNGFHDYLGMHAVSQYLAFPSMSQSYSDFAHDVRNAVNNGLWATAESSGIDIVPFASTGFNPQPRFDCGTYCYADIYGSRAVVTLGTPVEVANHLRTVADLANFFSVPRLEYGYPRAYDPANIVLIYSWDEQSEGPGLMPTIGPDTSRIDAMRAEFNPVPEPASDALALTACASLASLARRPARGRRASTRRASPPRRWIAHLRRCNLRVRDGVRRSEPERLPRFREGGPIRTNPGDRRIVGFFTSIDGAAMSTAVRTTIVVLVFAVVGAAPAAARTFDVGEVEGSADLEISYGPLARVEHWEADPVAIANGGKAASANVTEELAVETFYQYDWPTWIQEKEGV